MPNIPIVSDKEYLGFLVKYGCTVVHVRGSHHKIHNPATGKTAPVAIHSGKDLSKKAFANTLRQLGIDIDDFLSKI
jgi:predicted RNA binding protein YcfA (HicA-like mRNA interferase family)